MLVAVVRVMPRDAPVPPGPPQRAGGVRGAAPAHAAGAARFFGLRRRRGPDALARAAVKERDRGRCRVCGRTGFTHPHHRVPLGRGGGNGVANLISLCPSCHRDVHSWPGWAGVAGLLLPAGADAAAVPVVLPGRGVVWLTRDGQAVPADGAGGAAEITEVC